jgi:predicted amidohydrolase
MPTRDIIITGPTVQIEENGEDEERTLTCVVEAQDGRNVIRIVFPELTPAQLLCWGDKLVEAAEFSVDERALLSASSNYRIVINEDA